jgi:prophage antirepressor-like protein
MDIVKAFNTNDLHTEIVIKGTHEDPLFRASDIGIILDISSIRSVIREFNDSEKVVHTMHTKGGSQDVTFLTEKGLYKILFKSRKPIAEKFQNWLCEVVKELRLNGKYELEQQLKEKDELLEKIESELEKVETENKQLLEEKTNIQEYRSKIPTIYIYNTDVNTKGVPLLKIGSSSNIHERTKPYKQTHPFGKLVFTIKIPNMDLKKVEHNIHSRLSQFKVQGEIFQLDVEEAKLIIYHEYNFLNVLDIPDASERQLKIKQIVDSEMNLLNNTTTILKRDMSTQTDFIDEMKTHIINDNNKMVETFKKFVDEMCIVYSNAEVSSKSIEGQFRLWSRNTSGDVTKAFAKYLQLNFAPCRLKIQNNNHIVHGYMGIALKEINYEKQLVNSDVQTFVFNVCKFTPCGTISNAALQEEYNKWRISVKKEGLDDKIALDEIKKYLKEMDKYVLYSTIWYNNSNSQGYYGITLKRDEHENKIVSSSGKCVEKRNIHTNELLGTWATIIKAANSEKIATSKMSKSIKSKEVFNDEYYYTTI